MDVKQNVVILIPSLNPDHKLIGVIESLREMGFLHIVCVDDGSKQEAKQYFDKAREEMGCDILIHCTNLGKGRALKTGFNYIYNTFQDCIGVVTVDGDGQHSAKDTLKCAEAMSETQNQIIMGCRNFAKEQIPFRSRFGNILTSKLMSILCGIGLSDTQTGLRGIPMQFLREFVRIPGERFEYEMNMILSAKEQQIEMREVAIETIYIEDNSSSHFNPVVDSFKIYAQFGKFIFSSLSSFVVDIILFSLLIHLFKVFEPFVISYIALSTAGARVFSAIYNYLINRNKVFKSQAFVKKSLIRYACLAIVQCMVSAAAVSLLFQLIGLNETMIKIIVDTCLFIFSFQIQREWVFKK